MRADFTGGMTVLAVLEDAAWQADWRAKQHEFQATYKHHSTYRVRFRLGTTIDCIIVSVQHRVPSNLIRSQCRRNVQLSIRDVEIRRICGRYLELAVAKPTQFSIGIPRICVQRARAEVLVQLEAQILILEQLDIRPTKEAYDGATANSENEAEDCEPPAQAHASGGLNGQPWFVLFGKFLGKSRGWHEGFRLGRFKSIRSRRGAWGACW